MTRGDDPPASAADPLDFGRARIDAWRLIPMTQRHPYSYRDQRGRRRRRGALRLPRRIHHSADSHLADPVRDEWQRSRGGDLFGLEPETEDPLTIIDADDRSLSFSLSQ